MSWIDDCPRLPNDSRKNETNAVIDTQNCVGNVRIKFIYENIGNECVLEMEMTLRDDKPNIKPSVGALASKDGDLNKMKYRSEKWTVSWKTPLLAKCINCYNWPTRMYNYANGVVFDVVIDFNHLQHHSVKTRSTQHLLNLYNNPENADVTFNFENQTLLGHTCILASGSPVLAAMFKHNFKENVEKVVEIADIKWNIFAALLRFLYTRETDLENTDAAAELLVAADKYAIDSLKEECAAYITQNLTVENAISYAVLANLRHSVVLHEATSEFIARNAKFICSREKWMDVFKNYPELTFVVVKRIANF